MLPLRPGQAARRTHDDKRHGTRLPFAALDVATGRVIGPCYPRHRAAESRRVLDRIEVQVPPGLDVHLATDSYATHETPMIRAWLARRPRWHVHPTQTSSSWLNQVERFFALPAERQLRRGGHRSVPALYKAIERSCTFNTPMQCTTWSGGFLVQDSRAGSASPESARASILRATSPDSAASGAWDARHGARMIGLLRKTQAKS